MSIKSLLQLLLFFLIIFILAFIYYLYFYDGDIKNKSLINENVKNMNLEQNKLVDQEILDGSKILDPKTNTNIILKSAENSGDTIINKTKKVNTKTKNKQSN